MLARRHIFESTLAFALLPGLAAAQALPAAQRLNQLGPENEAMARLAGIWDVTETVWDAPGAAPATTTGLVAERLMIGSMLQEVLRPESDTSAPAIKRIDYLHFNRVEGRWDYVSMDTRAPVGIMPAWSFTRGDGSGIVLLFQPFAIPGGGIEATGQMLRMDTVITRQGPDRDTKDQHFILADGTGTKWLAHRYAYARRS